jgi:hypothetical protein
MGFFLVLFCLCVLWFAGMFSKNEWGKERLAYNAGIAPALIAAIPSLIGMFGSLFKGKKAQYSTNHNPQQAQAYQMLLKQLMTRMRTGQQSPAQQAGQQGMNSINKIFYS